MESQYSQINLKERLLNLNNNKFQEKKIKGF